MNLDETNTGGPDGAGATAEPAGATTPEGRIAALEVEKKELFERLQRVSAEFDNFQKRTKRDKAKWTEDTVRDVVTGFLPVIDGVDLSLQATAGEIKDPKVVRQAIELVRDQMLKQLGAYGIKPIPTDKGTPFDPDKHLAVTVQEVAGIDKEAVSFVARAGYMINETVLRPAQVGVMKPAKG
jgi:molecular chaperone GrpE